MSYLPKHRRITLGIFFMIFGAANTINPFINGPIFIFGGYQILMAKKKALQRLAKSQRRRTVGYLKKTALFVKSKTRKLAKFARKKRKEKQKILKEVLGG